VWLGQQAVEYEPDPAMSLGSKILICVGHFGLNIVDGRITQKSHRFFGGLCFYKSLDFLRIFLIFFLTFVLHCIIIKRKEKRNVII